ncbi:MAG: GIY-YIG nuclease family protein [Candidatus Lokiarchaeota archaeon]
MKPFGYIYIITNLINAKVYIGKTESTIMKRWYAHKWRANHIERVENPIKIDLAIKKYGENNFKIEEIDKTFNKEDLLKAEASWIKFYNATDHEKGYNIDSMSVNINLDDYESIWEIPINSEKINQKLKNWRESLVRKIIPNERLKEFQKDIKNLTGIQLEKKYGLYPNRRALMREIRRVLDNENIKTMRQAKEAVGGEFYNPKKCISSEKEEEFIEDFKNLKGVDLENKYNISRQILVRNIKAIFKKQGSQSLESANSIEDVKRIIGGKLYSISIKKIPSKQEPEFKNDVLEGLKLRKLCKKYDIGTTVFYKELERLCGVKNLTAIRNIKWNIPSREKRYIPLEKEQEFKEDLKFLSGSQLEHIYEISDRRILLREIRRILNNKKLKSMTDVKKFVGGEVYNRENLKKRIPQEKEKEFKDKVRSGMTRRELCEKYKFGTKVLYRELERLFNTKKLEEIRKK